MRRSLALLVALACSVPAWAHALEDPDSIGTPIESRTWGIGLGAATQLAGLTVKHRLSQATSVQVFAGLFRTNGFGLDIDVVRQMGRLAQAPAGTLNWALGLGLGLGHYSVGYDKHFMDMPMIGVVELNWHFQRYLPVAIVLSARPTVGKREGADTWGFYVVPAGAMRWSF